MSRTCGRWVLLLALTTLAASGEAAPSIREIGCPSVSVRSLDRSIAFFTQMLDFKLAGAEDAADEGRAPRLRARTAHLTLGDECLDLTEFVAPRGRPFPSDSRANDRWFEHIAIVVSDMDLAYTRLREADVRLVSNMPQVLPASNRDAAGIAALYFRDPDGHYLELIHFPADKGQAKWHAPTSALFEGIDHTAISVSNTARSLAFYRDALQMRVVGTSENFGFEQEHLSGVFNAHVRITSLRALSGIGVELLEYVTPSDGRPIPARWAINDIAVWQISATATASSHANPVDDPPHPQSSPIASPTHRVSWLRDPDGHLLKLRLYD